MPHGVRWLLGTTVAVAFFAALAAVLAETGLQPVETREEDLGAQRPRVRPGIDVLLADSAHLIAGKRVGLLTNQTGVDARGVPTVDRLMAAALDPRSSPLAPRLVALFAPEHHFSASLRPGETFGDTVDAATGLPIYSLYGANRAPTAAQLAGLDVLVADLQDVGVRTFTYISTIVVTMRAAAAAGKRVIVLDRPNPIGCLMQGPVLDTAYASFIGMLPVPLRHGMTMGELARFANGELRIGADLVVVPVTGWRRCDWFDRTGLPWVRPSPNLPDLEALAWYPGTVLVEATNLSVGRGTDRPFTQIGAPWLRPQLLRDMLRPSRIGAEVVRFTPVRPGDDKFDGVEVPGLRLAPLRRQTAEPIAVAVWLLEALAAQQSPAFQLDTTGFFRRLGVRLVPGQTGVCDTRDCGDWRSFRWEDQVNGFRRRVRPYLLYQ
jgi:uncharacterized protein YbbC (DUF1343 family)